MDKLLNSVFTNCVMNKWGEIFELDADMVSSSFDRFTDSDFVTNDICFDAWSRYLPNIVPSMLMSDRLLASLANTIKDDAPDINDKRASARAYRFMSNKCKFFRINFNEFDERLWRSFLDKMNEGAVINAHLFDYQKLLIEDVSAVRFEIVQYVLNNIGIVLCRACECPPFDDMIISYLEKYKEKIINWYQDEWHAKYDSEALSKEYEELCRACGIE